ncbi:MamK family actin-like protein [Paramagnetospirillum magneticum]|nr:MamK family actin-like protein [Paramagnetospirillum magneticum]
MMIVNDNQNILYVGIDFGYSKTVIMTSRGKSLSLKSLVGYPKDFVGLARLGRPYLVGDEAFEMRSYLHLRNPLLDGLLNPISEQDIDVTRHFISHIIKCAEPAAGEKVFAVIGVTPRFTAANKKLLLKLAQEYCQNVLLMSAPFLAGNSIGKASGSIIIDIGAWTTDICAMKGRIPRPEDQSSIAKAGSYIDERLKNSILERYPALQINANIARMVKEQFAFVGRPQLVAACEFRSAGKAVRCDVTEQVRAACESPFAEIAERIGAVLCVVPPEDQALVLKNIVITGAGAQIRGLPEYVKSMLAPYGDARVSIANEPLMEACKGALSMAQEIPPHFWGQL